MRHPDDPPDTSRFDSDTIGGRLLVDIHVTKIWFGRHWWYVDTQKKFKHRNFKVIGRWSGIVSYKKGK